jgi:hypothetical protein
MFDGLKAFKALKPGNTPEGIYQDRERYGRFQGNGSVEGEFELPAGEVQISVERYWMSSELDVELTGPGGAVALNRIDDETNRRSSTSLYPVADAKIDAPGPHRLRLSCPDESDLLVVTVGTPMTAGSMLKGMFGGGRT